MGQHTTIGAADIHIVFSWQMFLLFLDLILQSLELLCFRFEKLFQFATVAFQFVQLETFFIEEIRFQVERGLEIET